MAKAAGKRILASGSVSFISPDGSRVAVTDYDLERNQVVNERLELFSSGGNAPQRVLKIGCHAVYWAPTPPSSRVWISIT